MAIAGRRFRAAVPVPLCILVYACGPEMAITYAARKDLNYPAR
jgi:hypothetical protein